MDRLSLLVGYGLGILTGLIYFLWDWWWHDYGKAYFAEKKRQRAMKKNKQERDEAGVPTPARMLDPDKDAPSPPSPIPHDAERSPATDALPATQEHPAPSTGLIDFRQAPPSLPIPMPYSGPERRLRSDNPYPELRRRADDRERFEDSQVGVIPPVKEEVPRETRAEARRRREADESPEPSENPE